MDRDTQAPLCKSIFSGGANAPSPQRFTQAWVELINRMERNQDISADISSG